MTTNSTLLLGPGPSNAHPQVLEAMSKPLVGHLDPRFLATMDRVQGGLRTLFGTSNEMTLPISATGSAGMEASLVNLLEPGDRIVVGVAGVFGNRMCDVATRAGAMVTRVDAEWGTPLDTTAMAEAIRAAEPKVVAFVHAETSTGVLQPVSEISRVAREAGALVVLDTVTSLGGVELSVDDWGIDAAYSGTQKCLSVPPGLSPVTFSERAIDHILSRSTPVQSWYLDISLLAGYFGSERVYHHTAPIAAVNGLAAGIEIVLDEGIRARAARHEKTAQALLDAVEPLGFLPLVKKEFRLPPLTTLRLPQSVVNVGESEIRARLLAEHDIEVGGGLGKLAGKVWRVGLMGENARPKSISRLVDALQAVF